MQGRALRVYYYNNLWHYYGNIPFYWKTSLLHIPLLQLSADEVYNNLITDVGVSHQL